MESRTLDKERTPALTVWVVSEFLCQTEVKDSCISLDCVLAPAWVPGSLLANLAIPKSYFSLVGIPKALSTNPLSH